ncbi:RCC1-like G exchanging factor-like protein [Aethina tumida]|uniref:RCC1-like G exchanging factor-like protein n=1 Tax=Aethina tumida TaxID=116153 RepID=UPI00096B317E|nr:RCC1-like G exchanging factor-like protein [Aethina tumida]
MNKTGKTVLKTFKKYFSSVKRKYPINRDEEKKLPIFQYGVSKDSYQRIYSWGNTTTGALGIPYIKRDEPIDKVTYFRHPKRVTFGERNEVTTAACGFGFTLFAVNSDDHKLYGSGINTDSQIGYHEVTQNKPLEVLFYPKPIHLPLLKPTSRILKLAAGRAHSVALTDEGVFLQGNNSYGQCGRKIIQDEDYVRSKTVNHLTTIDGKDVKDVICGQDHTLLLMNDGSVYSCGWGADGQTGLGHYKNVDVFHRIKGDIDNENIVQLACRSDFVLAINDKGEVFGWGNTEYNQLCSETEQQQQCNPTFLKSLCHLGKVKSVATGGSFCLAVNDNGEVFSWGYGLLGVGPNVQNSKVPLQIPDTLFGKNDFQPDCMVENVYCGLSHAGAVTNNGDLYMWGRNRSACLGLGHEKDQYFPFKVSLGAIVKEIFCGVDHTVALCKPFI